ncbi:efflux transporter outer membrane subunit [Pseudomonas alabamensis]|uniref:efflux transporter outer membrane subunit n=1 Tax=Pseudomonas alabamensis TaxID=3064349 RepID=UPI003F650747
MRPLFASLTLAVLLSACSNATAPPDLGLQAPPRWHSPAVYSASDQQQWWQSFGSAELDRLIAEAQAGSYDVAAAAARVRQARATAAAAAGPLLPEVVGNLDASRQKQLRRHRYTEDGDGSDRESVSYAAGLSASYELDFWGGNAAARDSALSALRASEFDQGTITLTLLGNVADAYLRAQAYGEQLRLATLNLANAQRILDVVRAKYEAGSATALELEQQEILVAGQQRRLPSIEQQAGEARITLAALLGRPVQDLRLEADAFAQIRVPPAEAGLPSELLTRRPDVASAEALLAAAHANVQVARAAMLPRVVLTASLGSASDIAAELLRSPFYNLAAGITAPIFNNGRLRAERDRAQALEEELLATYRRTLVDAFADVEKALNDAAWLDRQQRWQRIELEHAQRAFDIAQTRYQAGAELLLNVLDAQRTLYESQDQGVQLQLQRLQASVDLYKALGGGWQVR